MEDALFQGEQKTEVTNRPAKQRIISLAVYEYEEGNSGFIDQRKRYQVRGNRSLQPTAGGISLKQGGGTGSVPLAQAASRSQKDAGAAPLLVQGL
ncbi:hypothetical protein Anapl_03461 [Anas platyrhynchos]|uniref:Uncharacterized protein n=1 Tax=Anas platyrhynchos TaxID=8839 RepID=R0LIF1_ANAPL|nr:hypothetical protein Anapl_03461 [Anas platyrhynchos]